MQWNLELFMLPSPTASRSSIESSDKTTVVKQKPPRDIAANAREGKRLLLGCAEHVLLNLVLRISCGLEREFEHSRSLFEVTLCPRLD